MNVISDTAENISRCRIDYGRFCVKQKIRDFKPNISSCIFKTSSVANEGEQREWGRKKRGRVRGRGRGREKQAKRYKEDTQLRVPPPLLNIISCPFDRRPDYTLWF